MKRYMPVTYVDENGECYTKEQLKNKLFKRNERIEEQRRDDFTGNVYIYTIQRIEQVRTAPIQGRLF